VPKEHIKVEGCQQLPLLALPLAHLFSLVNAANEARKLQSNGVPVLEDAAVATVIPLLVMLAKPGRFSVAMKTDFPACEPGNDHVL
jgi:hypothetical protein